MNIEDKNSKGVDFYLLKRNGSKQCAPQNNIDAWGNVISIGTSYMEGMFYERVDEHEFVFQSFEDSPTSINTCSHLNESTTGWPNWSSLNWWPKPVRSGLSHPTPISNRLRKSSSMNRAKPNRQTVLINGLMAPFRLEPSCCQLLGIW